MCENMVVSRFWGLKPVVLGQPPDDDPADDDEDDEDEDDEAPDERPLAFLAFPLKPVVGLSIDGLVKVPSVWCLVLSYLFCIDSRSSVLALLASSSWCTAVEKRFQKYGSRTRAMSFGLCCGARGVHKSDLVPLEKMDDCPAQKTVGQKSIDDETRV
jgi:hypothetical protein